MGEVLLFGGTSSERRVSVASAQNIATHLPQARLWFWTPADAIMEVSHEALRDHAQPFVTDFAPTPQHTWSQPSQAFQIAKEQSLCIFNGLHGTCGEDGVVQGQLESLGVAFTASGQKASALAFDKHRCKEVVAAAGVPVAPSQQVDSSDALAALEHMFAEHGPVVAKPVAEGSSVGLFFVNSAADVGNVASALARSSSRPYLIEKRLDGRELTVGVIEHDGELRALPCSEVVLEKGRSFDYEGKYLGIGSTEITPAQIPDAMRDSAWDIARRAHRAIGCTGYSRTDVIATDHGVIFLETNTLPGLTAPSFLPQQLQAAGIPMGDFVAEQVKIGRARYG